jgi:hypothetical protein
MDANLNLATATTANPTSVGASGASKGLDPSLAKPMNGQEFAGVMRDLMAKGERQELAGTETMKVTDASTAALQTLNLGSQFSVITAVSPLPDPNSLAEFARAQGLSETAVQALFGDLATKPVTDMATGLTPAVATGGATTLTLLPSAPPLGWIQSPASSLSVSNQVSSSMLAPAPNLAIFSAPQATNPKASDVNALLATAGATGVLKALGDMGTAPSQALGSADNLAEVSPELGPLDAMRMRMVPAWENMTRQLAKLNGTDQAAAWGQLTTNILTSKVLCGDVPEVPLDLGVKDPALLAALDTLQDQSNTGTISLDSARNTASTGTLGAAATSAALANPELTDRAAQIQDLADKLGKAMGERLQEQLERGEWKLQLKLNPAHLGRIDVELDMSSNGLDAIFKTDNQLTRELIAQGMNKLKDSLAESGMTVANVWVNSENQRGSGGNSTPRQNSDSDKQASAPVSDVKAAESRVKELRSSDAWDTLA